MSSTAVGKMVFASSMLSANTRRCPSVGPVQFDRPCPQPYPELQPVATISVSEDMSRMCLSKLNWPTWV